MNEKIISENVISSDRIEKKPQCGHERSNVHEVVKYGSSTNRAALVEYHWYICKRKKKKKKEKERKPYNTKSTLINNVLRNNETTVKPYELYRKHIL